MTRYFTPLQQSILSFWIAVLIVFLPFTSSGQSDECATATQLTNLTNFCSANGAYTNAGSSSSGYSNATCWTGAQTEDVWFSFVAIGTDVLINVDGSGTGGGTINQARIAVYTGTCASLTQLGSGCSNGAGGSSQVYCSGLIQGSTYFIRVASTAAHEGTFQLCINNYTPPASASADCTGAGKLCNKNPVSAGNLSGGGSNNNEVAGTCMGGFLMYENNSIWYTWTCATAGTLTFAIAPANPNDDIDFVVFQLSGANVCGPRTPIRCSATSFLNPLGTGLNATASDQTEAIGYNGSQDGFVQQITMTAGTNYAILINNASATSGFTLSWGGTGTFVGPDANITSTALSVCSGSAVTLDGTTSTNYTGLSWNFLNGPGSPVSATGPGPHPVTYPGPGTYTAILNATGTGGCVSTEAVTVTVTDPVIPVFSAIGPLCQNAALVLPATSTNGISGTWSPAPNTTTAGTTVYTFTPDPGQCAGTATLSVTVTSSSAATFAAPPSYCQGDNIPALPASSTNTPAVTGTWSPAVNNTTTTTYTFTPDAGQCAAASTLTITVDPVIIPQFTQAGPYCTGAAIPALPGTSDNSISGTWSPAVVSNTATGTYTFTPASGQCVTTAQMTIQVSSEATPVFTQIPPFCANTAAPLLPAVSQNGISGSWAPAVVSNTASGTYTFTSDGGQCSGQATMTITVNNPVSPAFSVVGSYCSGSSIPALPGTSENGIAGTWSPPINNTATTSYTFTPNSDQCAGQFISSIIIDEPVVTTFAPVDPFCSGAAVPSLPSADENGITGSWSPSFISNQASGSYTFTPSPGICALPSVLTVQVIPAPLASFNVNDAQLESPNTTVITYNNSENSISYAWDFGDGSTSSEENPSNTYPVGSGSYTITLTAVNAAGCSDEASVSVIVKEDILVFVPNAFTPDGDEHNNTLQPVLTQGFDPYNFEFLIFNRWGEVIFESRDASKGWDGTYHGELLKEGVYTWTMKFKDVENDDKYTYSGHVTLIR